MCGELKEIDVEETAAKYKEAEELFCTVRKSARIIDAVMNGE